MRILIFHLVNYDRSDANHVAVSGIPDEQNRATPRIRAWSSALTPPQEYRCVIFVTYQVNARVVPVRMFRAQTVKVEVVKVTRLERLAW